MSGAEISIDPGDGRSRTVPQLWHPLLAQQPSRSIYNVPFVRPLSKKSITRQHARVPNPLPLCRCELPPERETRGVYGGVEALKEEDRGKGRKVEHRWPSHIFILYWPLLTPRHRWNPLSSCAPKRGELRLFLSPRSMAVYPLDTRQLSIPISRISSFLRSFAFHFHTIIIIINFEL